MASWLGWGWRKKLRLGFGAPSPGAPAKPQPRGRRHFGGRRAEHAQCVGVLGMPIPKWHESRRGRRRVLGRVRKFGGLPADFFGGPFGFPPNSRACASKALFSGHKHEYRNPLPQRKNHSERRHAASPKPRPEPARGRRDGASLKAAGVESSMRRGRAAGNPSPQRFPLGKTPEKA